MSDRSPLYYRNEINIIRYRQFGPSTVVYKVLLKVSIIIYIMSERMDQKSVL